MLVKDSQNSFDPSLEAVASIPILPGETKWFTRQCCIIREYSIFSGVLTKAAATY